MVDRIKLVKCFNSFLDERKTDFSREDLLKFVKELPEDIFTSGYHVLVKPLKDDVESFKDFLITCGFGDESMFWACANYNSSTGEFDFNTGKLYSCAFILQDGIKRRYGINIAEIPLTNGIKRVELAEVITTQSTIKINATIEYLTNIKADAARTASYLLYSRLTNIGIDEVLNLNNHGTYKVNKIYANVIESVDDKLDEFLVNATIDMTAEITVTTSDDSTRAKLDAATKILRASFKDHENTKILRIKAL